MVARQIHLVRHGEVFNPDGILYGRIPGFHLSELGHKMAASAADALSDRPISRLYASPLQRAQESAAPWSEKFGLPIHTDDRLIEPTNKFEGKRFEFGPQVLTNPQSWPWITNPFRPSWGEAFVSIAARMLAVIEESWTETDDDSEVVLVSHQLPIWMVHRALTGAKLYHDPRRRRCNLSSITTLERDGDRFVEVNYQDPARDLLAASVDFGAV
ncbi:histidine phosphatase family protein [Salinibacterium sp. ZJ450]|uniref:histidine phosphatase family protein n=1 Tax=Salinibacterium sp. ZJ450 TaxID=2708338 RepID=UPI00142397FA|nr:histidine phosphatase family protein [Salinibacterium sp. ZJ450]